MVFGASIFVLLPGWMRGQEMRDKSMGGMGTREGVIGPNDALNIFVPAAEEMSKTWRVTSTGELNLPLVGTVSAAGKTVDEIERTLTEGLKAFIRDPQVTVSIVDFRSQPVTIMGAVAAPGKLQLEGRKTLLDVLMTVGGPRDAGPTLTLTRKADQGPIPLPEAREEEHGQYSVATLDLNDVLAADTPAANVVIQPQDFISVSPKPLPKLVHIIGEVQKSGAVELVQQQSVSLIQAVAAAGGVTHTAALRKTVIMHVYKEGVRTKIARIDLKKVMGGKVKDIDLVAGDIVIVPTSQIKTYLDLAAKSMVAGSGLLILSRF